MELNYSTAAANNVDVFTADMRSRYKVFILAFTQKEAPHEIGVASLLFCCCLPSESSFVFSRRSAVIPPTRLFPHMCSFYSGLLVVTKRQGSDTAMVSF